MSLQNLPTGELCVDFDGSALSTARSLGLEVLDCQDWGPRLRFCTKDSLLDDFQNSYAGRLASASYILFGSGDFHHLSARWLSKLSLDKPHILVTFDNHPDWDRRPPRWSCGGWINRALENPALRKVMVWGCANFELKWPNRLFANHSALHSGRLEIFPWASRLPSGIQKKHRCLHPESWHDFFRKEIAHYEGIPCYVSVDLDCLTREEAVTNWENGLFKAEDVAWAVGLLRRHTLFQGGDICGFQSQPRYHGFFQKMAGTFDHPSIEPLGKNETNPTEASATLIWRSLTGRDISSY